ncbi:MAG: TorF family putative porin [Methylotenera sp.]
MKKNLPISSATFILAAALSTSSMAEISANITASSNYVWRGVTQTADDAALSGGVDYTNESGFYAGTWTSNVSGGHELDVYFGFAGEAGDVKYDAGYIYYAYPGNGNADINFGEIYGKANMGMFSAGLAYTVNAGDDNKDNAFDAGDLYIHVGVGGELEQDWTWALTLGMYEFDADGNVGVGDISYAHYQVDLGKSAGDFGDFTFSLSSAEQESGSNDPKAFVSWSKGF